MSTEKKGKIQVTHQAVLTMFVVAILFGTLDIRRYVDGLKNLPDLIKTVEQNNRSVEQNSRDIKNILEILTRNKLSIGTPENSETAVTIYEAE